MPAAGLHAHLQYSGGIAKGADSFMSSAKPRLLLFIVAYNAERTIQHVLQRIPASLAEYDTKILIIDDSSVDSTFEKACVLERQEEFPFPLTVLFNPVNLGYGGNQKLGFHYAIREGYDFVALVHGDGQYAPEELPRLLGPLIRGEADAVFGSRMMSKGDALRGGMPLYKYVGNQILTTVQNWLLDSALSEFHSGYRLYSVQALSRIPFHLNADQFHFDTEIIIQLLRAGMRIKELPIPTYYGDEICHVDGVKYAKDVVKATLLARVQDLGILYERKFDVNRRPVYRPKLGYDSTHTAAIDRVQPDAQVLDIGCASGFLLSSLQAKGCRVTGIDQFPVVEERLPFERLIQHNLNDLQFPVNIGDFDYVLVLDVIEHLESPETFVDLMRQSARDSMHTRIIASTGNVGFIVTRLMLLFGSFNYGTRGILDLTHSRLFTAKTFRKLFEQAGYRIEEVRGIPAPLPLALGNNRFSRFLMSVNKLLMKISMHVFSYQILMVLSPLPSEDWLLGQAFEAREQKVTHPNPDNLGRKISNR
jgi:2-polyprenyl-3-methyl-5-hydroxy-6-metoxy-1,4-benzoquinol methylase